MNIKFAAAILVALVLGACGAKSDAPAAGPAKVNSGTPEEIAKKAFAAMAAKDTTALKALFPTKAMVDAALECKEGRSPWDDISRELEKIDKNIAEGGSSIEFVSMDHKASEQKTFAKGEAAKGCTMKAEVTMMRAIMTVKKTVDGVSSEKTGDATLMMFDGAWYLVDM